MHFGKLWDTDEGTKLEASERDGSTSFGEVTLEGPEPFTRSWVSSRLPLENTGTTR